MIEDNISPVLAALIVVITACLGFWGALSFYDWMNRYEDPGPIQIQYDSYEDGAHVNPYENYTCPSGDCKG